jgi:hypothetical protein
MDPMESMSTATGPVPKDFNPEDAGNLEDVRIVGFYNHHSKPMALLSLITVLCG